MLVLDAENIKLVSVNKKYIKNRYTGNLILSNEYRQFKADIAKIVKRVNILKPYRIGIEIGGRCDIDNCIKPIFDAMQSAKVIDNDKNILELSVKKIKGNSLRVWAETLNGQ